MKNKFYDNVITLQQHVSAIERCLLFWKYSFLPAGVHCGGWARYCRVSGSYRCCCCELWNGNQKVKAWGHLFGSLLHSHFANILKSQKWNWMWFLSSAHRFFFIHRPYHFPTAVVPNHKSCLNLPCIQCRCATKAHTASCDNGSPRDLLWNFWT